MNDLTNNYKIKKRNKRKLNNKFSCNAKNKYNCNNSKAASFPVFLGMFVLFRTSLVLALVVIKKKWA